jgi:type I restriction enzyme S subunit
MGECIKTKIGLLPKNWQVLPANEFCIKVADGTHSSPKQKESGKYLVTSKNIRDGAIDLSTAYKISLDDFNEINRRSKVDRWDVLLSMIGTVGEPCLISNDPDYAIKNVGLFKCGEEYKARWLFYYFKSNLAQSYILSRLSGTTQKYITLGELREFPIPLPKDESYLKSIVDLICSIDTKISLLHDENNSIEGIIRNLFKKWFFDFSFSGDNGKRQDSEIGDIPEGWKCCRIGEVIERITERIGRSEQSDYAVLSAVRTGDLVPSSEYFTKQVFSKDISKYIKLQKDDFAYNPARINIGSIGKLEEDVQGAVSPVYVAFRAKENFTNFVSLFIKTARAKKHIELFANGSVRQSLSYDDFASMEIVKPTDDVIEFFNETYEAVYKKTQANDEQIDTLKQMLDTLLPKLMSGELRVG